MSIRFELTEGQSLLQRNVREFLERECPDALVREAEDSELSHSPELWRKLADVGFLGLGIPEQYGGAGGLFDLGLFFEEVGRVLMPGPHIATLAIAAQLIAAQGTVDQKQQLLPAIVSGRAIVALALNERQGECRADGIATVAQRDRASYVISGTKLFIKDTAAATHLLVTARAGPGYVNAIIDAQAPGVSIRRFRVLSGDMLAEIQLEGVRITDADVIGTYGGGWQELAPALDCGRACLAAQMAGAADALMRKTVEYMNGRVTFGRPISSYQALQHRMAQIAMLVYGARHLAYNVLWKLSEGIECAGGVAMAKFFASDAYRQTTNESLQFHGAFGYSLEYAVQLYWRRMRLDEVVLGDSILERERAAQALGV
jgi:alkylation response protein AidB-like acyl-CoA dehydrogenase